MDNFYVYDVIVWPHTGRRCCAKLHSLLLVSFVYPVESYDQLLLCLSMIGLNRSYDLINMPCSFQLNCLHQMVLFLKKQDYSLIEVSDFCSIGSQCPISHKIGNARGVQNLKIRGASVSWYSGLVLSYNFLHFSSFVMGFALSNNFWYIAFLIHSVLTDVSCLCALQISAVLGENLFG